MIPAIGIDPFDEREQTSCPLIEYQRCAIAILDVGRMNGDVQQQTKSVDEDVELAAFDLLACIEALRVQIFAPF